MTTNEVTYDNRVMMRVAFGDKRREYLKDWFRAHELVLDGWSTDNRAYWAQNIERLNDAEIAFGRLVEESDGDATMAAMEVAA